MTRHLPLGAQQYHTHRQLLANSRTKLDGACTAPLDAIIVPASRPAVNLDHAVTLARALRCQLVVLCSREARASEVNELLDSRNFGPAIVVDLPHDYSHPKLNFATSMMAIMDLPEICINPNADLSIKRNLGLLLARMLGWQRVFFMDDDIRDLNFSDLYSAASMLGPYRAVGLRAVDFPDNSVVCHAHRQTGAFQDVFISGSALAVHCTEPVAFFPEIYNEDWFFFYHDAEARRLGWSGGEATQLRYDPFANPQRAAGQEFGDVLAEGLYGLLHYRINELGAVRAYWGHFLDSRMRFLEAIISRSKNVEPSLRQKIVTSVETAITRSRQIQPWMCEHYVKLWTQDLDAWERRLKAIPRLSTASAALRELSLMPSAKDRRMLTSALCVAGAGVPKAAPAGTVLIPQTLTLSVVSGIKPFEVPQGFGFLVNSDKGLSIIPSAPFDGSVADGRPRNVISRAGRRAGEVARRALLAEKPSDLIVAGVIRKGIRSHDWKISEPAGTIPGSSLD